MNPIAQAVAATFATAKAMTGEVVTYTTGEWGYTFPLTLTMVPGRSAFEATSDVGIVEVQTQDWLVLTSDMVLPIGAPTDPPTKVVPQRGDIIKDSAGRYWKALADGAEPPWRFNDQYRVVMRIHSKLVDDSEEA